MAKISIYGEPPLEFYLYEEGTYLYNKKECKLMAFNEGYRVTIETDKGHTMVVDINRLSPIPLTVKELDRYICSSTYHISEGIKEWRFEDNIPYKIVSNGNQFSYCNPVAEYQGNSHIPMTYLSDLEAVHNGFLRDKNALKIYEKLQRDNSDILKFY